MRAALVLETSGLVRSIDLGDEGSALAPLQAAVDGPIECVSLTGEFDMFIHEEGKFEGLERNPIATVLLHWAGGMKEDYIAGAAVFVGAPDDDGATTGLDYQQQGTLLHLFQAAADAVGPTEGGSR